MFSLWARVEKQSVFFPSAEVEFNPGELGLRYQDVSFPTPDGHTLHGWYIPASGEVGNPSAQAWLWFHGNGGNIGHRVEEIALLHRRLQVDLFIFDYRGYGRSNGTPSEKGTYIDARAALRLVLEWPGVDSESVVYLGHSLGSSVAVELAVAHPPLGLVLVSPLTSVRDMAKLTPIFRPFSWLVRGHFDSLARIGQVGAPLLVLHGDQDGLVPIAQGRKLFEAANEPKTLTVLQGADHNDTYAVAPSEFFGALVRFQAEISLSDFPKRW